MKFRWNYIIIPLIIALVGYGGSLLTFKGMDWYDTLTLPSAAPQGWFISGAWTTIFILSMIAVLIFWNSKEKKSKTLIGLLIANALLNVLWSALFFSFHLILWSVVEMIVLNIVNIAITTLFWKKHKVSAILWLPYIIWVGVATYLAYSIFSLNS
ncbi:MAG: tryptophan-rich sensory protein [Candidatus Pacebacteria bacterium]|nr:tryptophan-rich sensory protein [Candidatus Paceibacterota bacterium]